MIMEITYIARNVVIESSYKWGGSMSKSKEFSKAITLNKGHPNNKELLTVVDFLENF